jgi:5-carboxymethyl-2-hydroxymuconate isomerase
LKITTSNYDATLVNINNFIATLNEKVVNQGILSEVSKVTNKNMLARQWSMADLLNN